MPDSPNGVLNIDKPGGITSHDVVGRVRRILRTKQVGHAGTLDPDATGVLVIAVGSATRLLPYLPTEPKVYVARVAFGIATDSEDASGVVTAESDASDLTRDALLNALSGFLGPVAQVPPMVSALHHEGRRLYELAREGIVVERQARTIMIHELLLGDFNAGARATATLQVTCGGGTYIRTLCADLGAALQLPAHMAALRREAVGLFGISDALSLEALGELGPSAITPVERALDLPSVAVDDEDAAALDNGKAITTLVTPEASDAIFALLHNERLRALARWQAGEFHPFRVFHE